MGLCFRTKICEPLLNVLLTGAQLFRRSGPTTILRFTINTSSSTRMESSMLEMILQHLGTDDLQRTMGVIRDTPIPVLNGMRQTAAACEIKIARYYWFKCSTCKFDWRSWLRPSIVFVSLSFITERCPNCRRNHVPAYKVGTAASVLSQTIETCIDANMILSRHDEEAGGIRSPCKGSHRGGRDIEGWECPSEDRQTRQDCTHDG
jgi:hypothetical protein